VSRHVILQIASPWLAVQNSQMSVDVCVAAGFSEGWLCGCEWAKDLPVRAWFDFAHHDAMLLAMTALNRALPYIEAPWAGPDKTRCRRGVNGARLGISYKGPVKRALAGPDNRKP